MGNVSQSLAEFTRSGITGSSGEGPPRWIPFGQKHSMPKTDSKDKNFKALAVKEGEEKENAEFESQRLEAIQEAAKGEQKKFGGGNKNIVDSKTKRDQERFKREKVIQLRRMIMKLRNLTEVMIGEGEGEVKVRAKERVEKIEMMNLLKQHPLNQYHCLTFWKVRFLVNHR